ncbi:MAG: SUMF1/EgtB/PvdO family nonheme iron enzyme, partial [Myxococcota bacterium]
VEACMRSMRARPEDRYTDAGELAEVIATWLEGTQRRAQARRSIHASLEKQAHADGLRAKAEQLQTEAHTVLSQIGSWEQAHHKHAGWAAEDQAQSLEKEAVLAESESEQWLFNALSQAPNFTEVHNAIAQRYIEVHKRATTARDQVTAARAELYVRTHTEALPTQDSNRARYQRYLSGHGHLSLTTEPSEVNVALARFTAHHRRLVLDQPRVLGPTPLQATELEQGSYLLTLEAPGYDTVRYPVLIERQKHWNTTPPQATAPQSIQLPPKGVLDPETDCFIPAGWFQLGEQGAAYDTLPHGWQWLDSFVIKRHPVTNREYIAFLDDLVAQGLEEEALRAVPRERIGPMGAQGAMLYTRDSEGRFAVHIDSDGDMWLDDWPVVYIDWHSAHRYTEWLAEHTGRPWRLPTEREWEKAARGVDGRLYPLGNFLDPSWACTRYSHKGYRTLKQIDAFPTDVSPYGVRGMTGNVMDWCADRYDDHRRLIHKTDGTQTVELVRTYRGGSWISSEGSSIAPRRFYSAANVRLSYVGVRPCMSWPIVPA